MSRFSRRRTGCCTLIPVLVGISVVSFLLVKLSPGDPVRLLLGDRATEEAIAAVRERLRPRPAAHGEQFFVYVGNLLQGDLGRSIRYRVPVADLILDSCRARFSLSAMSSGLRAGDGAAGRRGGAQPGRLDRPAHPGLRRSAA